MTIQHFTHILTQTCRAGDGVDRTRPSARRMSAMSQLHERAHPGAVRAEFVASHRDPSYRRHVGRLAEVGVKRVKLLRIGRQ